MCIMPQERIKAEVVSPGLTAGMGHGDPVCHMVVYADENSLSASRNGKKYYFCSVNYRDTFLRRESHT